MTSAQTWEAHPEERDDAVPATAAAALHALLDAPGPAPAAGDPLPPLWHWLAFLPDAPQRALGPDGHPAHTTLLPPSPLPRRMYAGGRIEIPGRPQVGQPLHRHSLVTSVTEKSGRSGPLVFVEVTHTLTGPGSDAALTEVQDLVFRGPAAEGSAAASGSASEQPAWEWHDQLVPEPTLLFRFSALTYNAHRIHYDRRWATEIEGYPGLVVHGPLQAVALAELCRRHLPERRVATFSFRARQPAFDDAPLDLWGTQADEDHVSLAAVNYHGATTMTAEVTLHPSS